jgi:hypothetical protein
LVEQLPCKQQVVGSSPTLSTTKIDQESTMANLSKGIICSTLIVCCSILAYNHSEGWGWLLFFAFAVYGSIGE